MDRDWKKKYSVSLCLPLTLKDFRFLWVLWKSGAGKQEGCRQLGSAFIIPCGLLSHRSGIQEWYVLPLSEEKVSVLKYLVDTLGPVRKLCARVCRRRGLLREQVESAGLLQSTVQGNSKLLLCEAISSATIDRTSFLSWGPRRPSPAPSAHRGPKQCGGICTCIYRELPATFPIAPELPHRWHWCTKTAMNAQKSSRAV